MAPLSLILISMLFSLSLQVDIHVMSPPQLASRFPQPLKAHMSPIGYKPLSGRLEGSLVLADPRGACSKIGDVQTENEDFFVLADDTQCLQSIKAKNIATSGGYAGIIKANPANTLHDRQISLVHIPIIQLQPEVYDALASQLEQTPDKHISVSIDFTDDSQTHPINIELWFSPTEKESYNFLFQMEEFLNDQSEQVSFTPHYVLQSQRENKNYIGCLSSGRYCPSQIEYEGTYSGTNIVEESLRQIIIWDLDQGQWWKYIKNYYNQCIKNAQDVFQKDKQFRNCVQNSIIMSGIDQKVLNEEFLDSFQGSRKEVDDNTYLLQERQLYIREQITTHPTVLINKKPFELNLIALQDRICKMQGDSATGKCTPPGSQLANWQILVIILVIVLLFVITAALYKVYMHMRMKKQIKGEVDRTLEQYYRYIATFEGQNGKIGRSQKHKSNQKSRPLTEELQQVIEEQPVRRPKQVEMTHVERQ